MAGIEDLAELIHLAQQGDSNAYAEIVRRFQDMAYGYAYAFLNDFQLAQDAAQEAFIEAYACPTCERRLPFLPGSNALCSSTAIV